MTNQLKKSAAAEITRLHDEIISNLKRSLQNAIRIGELLTEQKAVLEHGRFTPWIKDNLPFTDRTARNYMRVYRGRDRLKSETVSDLKAAYKLLAAPNEKNLQAEIKQLRSDFDKADDDLALLQELRDRAEKLTTKAAEKILDAEADYGQAIKRIVSADWCEFTWTGLKIKREPTKQEVDEYWERIKWLHNWHRRAVKRCGEQAVKRYQEYEEEMAAAD
jgi:hypothetical protein